MKNIALILASGIGKRAGFDTPKQFLQLSGKTICEWSIEAFEKNGNIDEIILVVHPDYKDFLENLVKNKYKKITRIVTGGKERIDSSRNGVFAIEEKEANVFIHDSVRPFVTQKIIDDCAKAMEIYSAVDVALDVTDTIFVCKDGIMQEIPPRKFLKKSQTPQCFKLSLIKKAHEKALEEKNIQFTDDCGLILQYKLADIYIVDGDEKNIKITYKSDIEQAQRSVKGK